MHAGGRGLLTIWTAGEEVICQVQDGGRIDDPLVGRRPPAPPDVGHGLFTVHQVCDLVRVHRRRDGTRSGSTWTSTDPRRVSLP